MQGMIAISYWFILLLVIIGLNWSASEAVTCLKNEHISKLEILSPLPNSLVNNLYYTKLSAEILSDITDFRLKQHEFSICAISVVNDTEIFRECGRSVFGQGSVPGEHGINELMIELYHNSTMICNVNVKIECCAGMEDIEQIKAIKLQSTKQSFLKLGKELQDYAINSDIMELTDRSPNYRFDHFILSNHKNEILENLERLSKKTILIGIKSGSLNLAKRNSIRASWLRDCEKNDDNIDSNFNIIHYFLLGNSSSTIPVVVQEEDSIIQDILITEQRIYEDTLLAHELPIIDTYLTLSEKILLYANWTYHRGKGLNLDDMVGHDGKGLNIDYVVICDDDVYVDIWQLQQYVSSLSSYSNTTTSYYGGEVLQYRMHEIYKPIRDPHHRNYLSRENYPLDILPPFALGNFYILSGDLWDFIGRNAASLRPTGTLEDVSVAVWMSALQVFPVHLPGVCDITRCLYDPAIFTTSTSASSAVHTPQQRLLAVADLQHSTDFGLLYRLTSYRQEQKLGNSEEILNLTKNTIIYIANKPSSIATDTTTTMDTTDITNTDIDNSDTSKSSKTVTADSTENIKFRQSGYLEEELTFSCNSNSTTSSYDDTILKIAVFIPNLSLHSTTTATTTTTITSSILQLIHCELSSHHVIEIVTLSTITDMKVLAALRRLGVRVQFIPGEIQATVCQSSHWDTGNNTAVSEIVSYLSAFDVIIIVPITNTDSDSTSSGSSSSSSSSSNDSSSGSGNTISSNGNSIVETYMIQTLVYQLATASTNGEQYRIVLLHLATDSKSDFSAHYLSALDIASTSILTVRRADPAVWVASVYNTTIESEQLFVSFIDTLSLLPLPPHIATVLQEQHALSLVLTPFSIVYTGSVQVILGIQALYAMEMLERILHVAFPSIVISRWIVLDVSTLSTDWHSYSSDNSSSSSSIDISMQVINKQHEVQYVLSAAEMATLRSERTVLLLSVLDCAELHLHNPEASQQLQWTEKSELLLNTSMHVTAATTVLLLSGEPMDLSKVGSLASRPPDLTLVATTEPSLLPKYTSSVLYMPVYATSFFELQASLRNQHTTSSSSGTYYYYISTASSSGTASSRTTEYSAYSPIALLRPSPSVPTIGPAASHNTHTHAHSNDTNAPTSPDSKTRGIAYLYHRCDRTIREEFYSLLQEKINNNNKRNNDMLLLDALGKCSGKEKTPKNNANKRKKSSRYNKNYIYEAIALYKPYSFTIAFENSCYNDYITEKLINSYLANTIPIYYGAQNVNKYFHSNSMINCNTYNNLSDCADRVISVATNITLYNQIKTTIPVVSMDIWTELFPWENRRNTHNSRIKKEWMLRVQKYLYTLVH